MSPPALLWLEAFGWTLAVEAPIYTLWLHRPLGLARALAAAIGVNAATHPALWYAMPRFEPYALWLGVSEALVFATEALVVFAMLRARPTPQSALGRAAAAALGANAASTAVGLLALHA